jgi:hypothetical protein
MTYIICIRCTLYLSDWSISQIFEMFDYFAVDIDAKLGTSNEATIFKN